MAAIAMLSSDNMFLQPSREEEKKVRKERELVGMAIVK